MSVGLPLLLRRIVLAGGLVDRGGFTALQDRACRSLRRVNGIYAAKTIEDADPAFKNSLINYLELRRHRAQMPKAVMATLESPGRHRFDARRGRQRRQSTAHAASRLRALGPVRDLFALRDLFTQEHLRLDPPGVSGRREPPDQHPVRQHQARQRPQALASRRRRSRHFFGPRRGRAAARRSCSITASTTANFSPSETYAPGQMYDPWQVTLTNVQQSMDYYLTGAMPNRRIIISKSCPRRRSHRSRSTSIFPNTRMCRHRSTVEGGNVEAIEGTTGHRSCQDQHAGEPGDH